MAVESGPTPLGTLLPDATLPDVDGNEYTLSQIAAGNPTLIVFSANHCPW
jgi:cytochrome oxidase Cu insertion factor (SCO1/SenC/PrrC family)